MREICCYKKVACNSGILLDKMGCTIALQKKGGVQLTLLWIILFVVVLLYKLAKRA
jgi:hypothetical protein